MQQNYEIRQCDILDGRKQDAIHHQRKAKIEREYREAESILQHHTDSRPQGIQRQDLEADSNYRPYRRRNRS
jgi:hypothetical protein